MIPYTDKQKFIKNDNYFDDLHIIAAFHKKFPDGYMADKSHLCAPERYSLEMILSGKVILRLDSEKLELEAPCVFWIGDHHRDFEYICLPGCAYEHLWIDFAGKRGKRIYEALVETFHGYSTKLRSSREIAEFFHYFADKFKVPRRPGPSAENTLLIEQLVFEILSHCEQPAPELDDPYGIGLLAQKIKSEPFERYSAEELSAQAGISCVHFRAMFKQKIGISLHHYILQQQMLTAGELLKNSSFRIGELAEYCGFPDIGSFSRAFKRHYGVSPRKWKQLLSGKEDLQENL